MKGNEMEQDEVNGSPAERKQESGGCPCGCGGRKGSNKVVIAIWVALLLGGVSFLLYTQQRRAAEAGRLLTEAERLYYEQGDLSASTECLRQSAELGNVWAQLYYGERLMNGCGTARDLTEAVKWLRKAAKLKSPEAFYQLGFCYENGTGVERDLVQAEKWYRKASADPAFAASAQYSLERIESLKAAGGAPAD
jgi:hypothetical protein